VITTRNPEWWTVSSLAVYRTQVSPVSIESWSHREWRLSTYT